jgi:hypothetical protein
MVLSILLERPLVKQLDLADGPNFSDASRKSIGVASPFRELPEKRETGLRPDSDVGNMVPGEDIGAGDGGKLRPETDIGAFRARRKAWV